MKFKVSKKRKHLQEVVESCKQDEGILYLLYIELEGIPLVKIGITTRSIEERVSQLLVSIFTRYRIFPFCNPKRFRKTDNIKKKEKALHEYFKEYRYHTTNKFGGHTEMFDVPLSVAVEAYEKVINGEELGESIKRVENVDDAR